MKTLLLILFALVAPITTVNAHTDTHPMPEVTHFCNTASVEQLKEVKGFGKVLAARIVAAREFKSVHDVLAVKGVGKVKLAALQAYVDKRAE